jgi:hypothetical protein
MQTEIYSVSPFAANLPPLSSPKQRSHLESDNAVMPTCLRKEPGAKLIQTILTKVFVGFSRNVIEYLDNTLK